MSRPVAGAALCALLFAAGAGAVAAWQQHVWAVFAALLVAAMSVAALLTDRHARRQQVRTEYLPASARLAQRENMQAMLLDLAPLALLTADSSGHVHVVNRAARQLLGADDLVLSVPPELAEALTSPPDGLPVSVQLQTGGVYQTFALSSAAIQGPDGPGRLLSLLNIETPLRTRDAETMRELLRILSHEIMNALTPIASLSRTAADIIGDTPQTDSNLRDAVETVARRSEALQRFGEAYSDLARLPPPVMCAFAVQPWLADLQRLFEARWKSGAILHIDASQAPDTAIGDSDQLNAAVWALLQNAVEAAGDDTEIHLVVATRAHETVFTICDDGPGIPAELTRMIFRPFYTTKPTGSGVGLALARQIMRGHGGELALRVDGSENGACFEASLPGAGQN